MSRFAEACKAAKLQREAARLVAPDFSPSDKAAAEVACSEKPDRKLIANPTHHGVTKMKAVFCPAKIFGRWHDKETRKIARDQARQNHLMWGPCKKPNEPRTLRQRSYKVSEPKPGLRQMPWQAITPRSER